MPLKRAILGLTLVSAIAAALIAADARYAKSSEVREGFRVLKEVVQDLRLSVIENRVSTLRRESFDLSRVAHRTGLETQRLQDVENDLENLRQEIRVLRSQKGPP